MKKCTFVDNGLLRLNEGERVMKTFADNMGVKVIRADAEQVLLERLAGVSDPEAKRKIIGGTFIEVFEEHALNIGEVNWLAQGTIYPDVIESAAAKQGVAHVISRTTTWAACRSGRWVWWAMPAAMPGYWRCEPWKPSIS